MRRFIRTLPLYCIWTLLALLLVSWLFDLRTDPAPERQIVILTDGCPADTKAFEKALLPHMPEGIGYIRVRTLAYSFFDTETGLPEADLYILPGSEAEEYAGILTPLGSVFAPGNEAGALGAYLSFEEGGAAGESYALYSRARGLSPAHDMAVQALAGVLLSLTR